MTDFLSSELPFEVPDGERDRMQQASSWFFELQKIICDRFEQVERAHADSESAAASKNTRTTRRAGLEGEGGGGIMAKFKQGAVFEKAGVNCSEVFGILGEKAQDSLSSSKELPGLEQDPRFWAAGISLVCHMRNPLVPAVHMNTRMFWTPIRCWFGGGTDLNPAIEFAEDTEHFHAVLKGCCDRYSPGFHQSCKEWADRYFFIRHRNRPRGVGGVFFDDLNSGDWERDFAFVKSLGIAFLDSWLPIVERRQTMAWTDSHRETQLAHRGAYVEFNLIQDRGTRFGLETGHDPDAVLMSLPPLASWP